MPVTEEEVIVEKGPVFKEEKGCARTPCRTRGSRVNLKPRKGLSLEEDPENSPLTY